MTERQQHLSWPEKEARRDRLSSSERGGEIASIIGTILVSLFFYAHQLWSTGFFTSAFGQTESFFLYGSILAGMAGPAARLATGRRNVARIPETAAAILWIAASLWLLRTFPFNFAHFADVIPNFLQFLVKWITNDIARILFVLGTVGGVVFAVIDIIMYIRVRKLLRAHYTR